MEWTYKTFKFIKYTIATLLLFNAFQAFLFKTHKSSPSDIMRELVSQEVYPQTYNQKVPGSKTEKISFFSKSTSGSDKTITRTGLLTLRSNALGTVLLCHGYGCNKYDIGFFRTLFPNYNTLVFDFRAHGENRDGQSCTFGKDEAYDVIAAAEFIKNHPRLKNKKLFGYGFSMGASSLIEAQSQKNLFDALILDCPYDSSDTLVEKGLERLKVNFLGYEVDMPGKDLLREYAFHPYGQEVAKIIFKYVAGLDSTKINSRLEHVSPGESIKKISVPCFFIQCKNDDKIPLSSIQTIYNGAQGFKRLWLTDGRGHCDSFFFNPERYINKANQFLAEITKTNIRRKLQGKIEQDG
jgi:pimeloyl-ACP methyl ester carboxylesterase